MSKIVFHRGPSKLKIDPSTRSVKWEAFSLEENRIFSNPVQIRVRQVQEGSEVPILVARFEIMQSPMRGTTESSSDIVVALHQSHESPTIFVADVKLTPGKYRVDVLRAKKPKGGTWERLPRSPFEITVIDSDLAPVPRNTSPPKPIVPPLVHISPADALVTRGSTVDLKLATAEPVPLSKITLPRLPSIPSNPPTPSSRTVSFIDNETFSSAINAAMSTKKKLSTVEPVISWTVIVHGLLACIYVGFLITKTLRE